MIGVKVNRPGASNRTIKPKKPSVVFICDVKNWAWYFKSLELKKHLSDDFDIYVKYHGDKIANNYDVYFTFGYNYIDIPELKNIPKVKKITGITAHRPIGLLEPKMKLAGAVHANSKLLYNDLLQMHDNVYYLPNGVDEELFSYQQISPTTTNGKIVIGHVGKLSPLKGQYDIIEPSVKKAKCLYHPNYNNHTGALPHKSMPGSVYKQMDALIIASIEDGTPNPALEAAACGRTIISNHIGNMPEFIEDGVNGFLVPREVDSYVEKIEWLSNNRDELIEMGLEARKTIEEGWTWKIQAENYRKMLWDVIDGKVTSLSPAISTSSSIATTTIVTTVPKKPKVIKPEKSIPKKPEKSSPIKKEKIENKIKTLTQKNKQLLKKKKIVKKPKVLFLADVKNWAWDFKSQELKKYLSDDFDIDIKYSVNDKINYINPNKYAVYFTFGHRDMEILIKSNVPIKKRITGITAKRKRSLIEPKIKKAHSVHANSKLLLKYLKTMHDNVYYLPNGVDEKMFSYSVPDIKEVVIGHIAKKNKRKGQDDYIKPIINLTKVNNVLHHLDWRDKIPHNKMLDIYKQINVIIVASIEDGTPNPALEAAACGRTIISNHIGNMPEFIEDGVNGFLVPREVDSYVEKIEWLSNNRDELIEMGLEARKTIEEGWTWKIQAENYRKMLWDVIDGK